jgi:nucleoside-diphosphate-sugar epimerase
VATLVRLARSPWPLPLGGLQARRSLLSVDNLVDAVATLLAAPGPLRRPFIVADAEPLSVGDMIAALRAGLGRRPGLIPVPTSLIELGLRAAGHAEWYERLAASLIGDTSALRGLGWSPRVDVREGLAALTRNGLGSAASGPT